MSTLRLGYAARLEMVVFHIDRRGSRIVSGGAPCEVPPKKQVHKARSNRGIRMVTGALPPLLGTGLPVMDAFADIRAP